MKSCPTLLCLAALVLAVVPAMGQETPPAAPQEPTRQQPTAEDLRREALQKGLEAQLKGTDVRVSLRLKDATVQQGIEEFRRQVAGWDFNLDATNIPPEYRIDEFVIQDKPWRDAFEAFMAKTGLMIDEERPGIIYVSKPARVTFSLKDADVKSVIDLIARISRANIVTAPEVTGKITLSVNDVPWNVVLDTVVRTVGNYTVVRERFDILRIVSASVLLEQMETKWFRLRYLYPAPFYRAKMEPNKQFVGQPPIPPTSEEEIIKRFTLLTMLRTVLTRGSGGTILGRIDYDMNSNTLAVTDTKVVLERVSDIIKMLDVEPEQVIIDVKFVSTTNDDLFQFGTNWQVEGDDGVGFSTMPMPLSPDYVGLPAATPAFGVGKVSRLPFGLGQDFQMTDQFFLTTYDMKATFRAFKSDKFSKLIQQPTLAVMDKCEATIFVGESISYAETRATSNQFGGLEFAIAEGGKSPAKQGFQLLVIPRVLRGDNKVMLTVIPQNEVLTGSGTQVQGFEHFEVQGGGTPLSIDLPRVQTSSLITQLMVESGRTVVLGGLMTERVTYEDKKVPLLGEIPLLGALLFKSRSDRVTREHLMVFLTPRIVRGARESEQNLRTQLRQLEELERRRLEDLRRRKQAEEKRRADELKLQKDVEEQRRRLEEQIDR